MPNHHLMQIFSRRWCNQVHYPSHLCAYSRFWLEDVLDNLAGWQWQSHSTYPETLLLNNLHSIFSRRIILEYNIILSIQSEIVASPCRGKNKKAWIPRPEVFSPPLYCTGICCSLRWWKKEMHAFVKGDYYYYFVILSRQETRFSNPSLLR